jgi:nucleolar protein 14
LEALHELIAKYAATGEDASLIIQRIHISNSVRLDRRNGEKMQNYYDVLLRRFVAVGDAIFESGDGGAELGRYRQLNTLIKVIYGMAQDAPDTAGAVWSRRLGIFQNAHAKRMRDADFLHVDDGDDDDNDGAFASAWPSTGTFLLLRALGHVFPVTDSRHYVVTPTILLLGQMVAHTPILSLYDVVMGVLCSGLILEYTKEAKRVAPEALGFLAGVVRLFAPPDSGHFPVPSLEAARHLPVLESLRERVIAGGEANEKSFHLLSVERSDCMGETSQMPTAILVAALSMIEQTVVTFHGAFTLAAEPELFSEVSESLVSLCPTTKEKSFPKALQRKIASVASSISKICPSSRAPLSRRLGPSIQESAVKSLAPRMEDPSKYSMSKDKGKKSVQAAVDRTRREYKREHKAISRELRLDAAFIETERRKDKETKDSKARAKRQKNFAWLEGEQESMNQQVRQGGGLLRGGGTGLARAKASTAKMGIKKGGKF